jgi:peptidoglycan/xylan/chitin deacetylase (PgdA/CDA1 family)
MTPLAGVAALCVAALLILAIARLRPRAGRLPILVYHKIKPAAGDRWTVTTFELDRQWRYLSTAGYRAISCAELIDCLNRRGTLPAKAVLITLDDAYRDVLTYAYPLLEQYALRATLLLPVKFIGGENAWDGGGEQLLDYEQLGQMSPAQVELGLHSYAHGNFRRMPLAAIEADLRRGMAELRERRVPFTPVLAYPYGAYPRFGLRARAFRRLVKRLGVECGLRVGNRVNFLSAANRYALCRLDIRSTDTLETFRRKLEGRGGGT